MSPDVFLRLVCLVTLGTLLGRFGFFCIAGALLFKTSGDFALFSLAEQLITRSGLFEVLEGEDGAVRVGDGLRVRKLVGVNCRLWNLANGGVLVTFVRSLLVAMRCVL